MERVAVEAGQEMADECGRALALLRLVVAGGHQHHGVRHLRLQLRASAHGAGLALRNIRQNVVWAFVYNVLGVPVAAGLLYPVFGLLLSPMTASAAMSLSSVSVIDRQRAAPAASRAVGDGHDGRGIEASLDAPAASLRPS
jgi:hypothetical protein